MKRIFMRYPGGRSRALTFSFDDGVQQDKRFIGLLRQYGLCSTFNLNSGRFIPRSHTYPAGTVWRAMVDEEVRPTYTDPHCGIACHTAHHPTLLNASEAEIADEILSDRIALERLFGRPITGLAIPNGPYNETTIRIAKQCGITYIRSPRSSHSIAFPTELCPFDSTASYRDPELPAIAEKFLHEPCIETPYLLYIWGHTYNFDEHEGDWERIEQLMQTLSGRDTVWYAPDEQIFAYAAKFDRLEKSADGHRLYNPTDIPLWLSFGGPTVWDKTPETILSIAPGEELVV